MSEENEQLPSQATAAAPPEAQPNLEDAPIETGTRVMIDNTDPSNITHSNNNNNKSSEEKNERKEYLESLVTIDLLLEDDERKNKNEHNNTNNNNIIEAFYNIAWPILESEGGWTMVKGTGNEEGITVFCTPGVNTETINISDLIAKEEEEKKKTSGSSGSSSSSSNDDNTSQEQQQQTEISNLQGSWKCNCGVTNEENTIRCMECFGWKEAAEGNNNTNTSSKKKKSTKKKKEKKLKKQLYYIKIRHVIEHILQKENEVDEKAANAYCEEVSDAMELFGDYSNNNDDDDGSDSISKDGENSDDDEEGDDDDDSSSLPPQPPSPRLTRQRFSDIAWKENRTHYEKSSSRVGVEYQVDVLPVAGSYQQKSEDDEDDDVLYDQIWDLEKAKKSGKIDFIDHRVKSSIKEPAYELLHRRDYRLPGFYEEVSKVAPTDCSHWTAEERAKFRKLVFEKHEDMWQISEALGRPVRECVTYYLGKFKTSKDFRSLRRAMEKARDENPFKYPGEILCDKCGKGGKLVYCDSCDSHYHLTCQDPPLQDVPENNDWKCNKCMEQKEATETEDTSNGEEVEEAATSVEGQRNDTNDDVDVASSSTANQDQEENNNIQDNVKAEDELVDESAGVAEEEDSSNDANVASQDEQGVKRPNSDEEDQHSGSSDERQAKKARNDAASNSNGEEDASMTTFSERLITG